MEENKQKEVRIVVVVKEDKRRQFKSKCALKGQEMTENIVEHIDKTIAEG